MKKIRPSTPRAKRRAQLRPAASLALMLTPRPSFARPDSGKIRGVLRRAPSGHDSPTAAGGPMDESETKSLPENAYRPLATRRGLPARRAGLREPPRGDVALGPVGPLSLRDLHRGIGVFRASRSGRSWKPPSRSRSWRSAWRASTAAARSLLENVIITGIGGVSGVGRRRRDLHAAGALHPEARSRIPGRRSSSASPAAASACCSSFPLRRYFVRDMHGQFPYPEATAITEVLVTGEKGGSQAKLLLQATGIAAVYDFFVTTFQVWKEFVDFRFRAGLRRPGGQGPHGPAFRRRSPSSSASAT